MCIRDSSTTCAIWETFETHDRIYGLAVVGVITGNNTLSDRLWVAGTDAFLLFNQKGQQLASVSIVGGPQLLCIPTGLTVYVTMRQGTVVAVDLNTLQAPLPCSQEGTSV